MSVTLEPGQEITIYQKPLSMEDPEGKAVLVRREGRFPFPNRERWLVRFPDGEEVHRMILTEIGAL